MGSYLVGGIARSLAWFRSLAFVTTKPPSLSDWRTTRFSNRASRIAADTNVGVLSHHLLESLARDRIDWHFCRTCVLKPRSQALSSGGSAGWPQGGVSARAFLRALNKSDCTVRSRIPASKSQRHATFRDTNSIAWDRTLMSGKFFPANMCFLWKLDNSQHIGHAIKGDALDASFALHVG